MRKAFICLIALMISATFTFAQTTTVKGKVTDRNGQPLEKVSVKEKGTSGGTFTDRDGNFSLSASSKDAVLVFSGAGLTEQEVTANSGYADVTLAPSAILLGAVEIVGTRSLKRSATETAVPVDIIPISKIMNTVGQVDLNQVLQYVAPSFNSNRQSGSDGADHVDPASLRGLGPDQTLVLVNGKRWHQSSLVNLFGSRGRGNTGTDLNAIPAAAIERIEILRDGAAAQYGSDAIAGVVNIILKSSVNQGTANVSASTFMTGYGKSLKDADGNKIMDKQTDGLTINANVNYGFTLKNNGFINITGDYLNKAKTYRSNFKTPNEDDPRRKAGDGSVENYSLFFNSGFPIKGNTSFYAFGGIGYRKGSAYAYTRSAGSSRNVPAIYPDGFDPLIGSKIGDKSVSFGIKTKFGGWNTDFNATLGSNRFEYGVSNTLNTSLGASSPTKFKAGGFQLAQNMFAVHLNKSLKLLQGLNVAVGTEIRQDQYKIFKGEIGSYKQYPNPDDAPGGSQGFPGFQPADETNKQRVNWGVYADGELDVNKQWMISAATRVEKYSDFGWTANWKLASRVKITEKFALRGSVSTGFRAPSLPQINFSNTFTNVAAGVTSEVVIAPNSGSLAKLVGIPALKQETSLNGSFGFTTKPIRNLSITVDGYMVNIKDRVVLTGYFDQSDDAIGTILQDLNIGSAQFFTNAVDTKTKGLDIIATYSFRVGAGKLSTTFAGNFNKLEISKVKTASALSGKEDIYFSLREKYFLQASAPNHKLSFGFEYKLNNFTTNLRFTNFAAIDLIDYDPKLEHFKARTVTDLSFSYLANEKITITVGGANIFDVYPEFRADPGLTETGTRFEALQMGMGGAMYFAKVGIKF
ncbi:MAG: TonB-dependent receptor [Chitinophagaceae bacterium]|nr:TonB-dependent receptor [Chitinophagaceae bacterium]